MDRPCSDVEEELSALIESDYDYRRPRRGQVCEAFVPSIANGELLVDLDFKRDGVIRRDDVHLVDEDPGGGSARWRSRACQDT